MFNTKALTVSQHFPFNRKILKNPFQSTHVVSPGLDLRVESVLVLVPEGRVADQENVEDDPARPDVHGLAIRLLLKHLGGQVTGSSGKTFENDIRSYAWYIDGKGH